MAIETCPHGRPVNAVGGWDWIIGKVPCDDCDREEWNRVKPATIVGLIILVALIWVPLCLLLAGVFW